MPFWMAHLCIALDRSVVLVDVNTMFSIQVIAGDDAHCKGSDLR